MEEEVQPVAFTVPGCELKRVLANALLFASTDRTLPSLCAVQFTVEDGKVAVWATDKYILSRENVPVWKDTSPEGEGAFEITREYADTLVKNPVLDSPFVPVVIGWDGGEKVQISAGDAGMWTFDTPASQYPNIAHLWEAKPTVKTDSIGINPRMAARFAKVRTGDKYTDKNGALRLVFQESGPMRVAFGSEFEARWMPVRLAS